ncbi:hypothetical protein BpHYR1_016954 [Brachionus plicatilis]|uniref:Uncharacterized protein n=1 Tax=Brachionus plicatilis TaxID=10195 RepID=A0A3M7SS10_BRAPC|nr:hypothetical protein BpHYR1_016954 [Brachionus plicatilis]
MKNHGKFYQIESAKKYNEIFHLSSLLFAKYESIVNEFADFYCRRQKVNFVNRRIRIQIVFTLSAIFFIFKNLLILQFECILLDESLDFLTSLMVLSFQAVSQIDSKKCISFDLNSRSALKTPNEA